MRAHTSHEVYTSVGHSLKCLYGEAPPERGTFLRLQVYERVRILVVNVWERAAQSVISVGKKARKGKQMHFIAVKKSRKRSGFVIFKTVHLRQLKGMHSSKQGIRQ